MYINSSYTLGSISTEQQGQQEKGAPQPAQPLYSSFPASLVDNGYQGLFKVTDNSIYCFSNPCP